MMRQRVSSQLTELDRHEFLPVFVDINVYEKRCLRTLVEYILKFAYTHLAR